MRNLLLLFAMVLLGIACNDDDDDMDTNMTFETTELDLDVNVSFYETDLGFEIDFDEFQFFDLHLEALDVGRYEFGRGKKNIMIYSFHHYSSYKLENSGYFDITKSDSEGVSGTFEVYCESDFEDKIDTIRGDFTDVPLKGTFKRSIGQGCGFVNEVELSNSWSDYNEFGGSLRTWRLFRPDDEWLTVTLNRNGIMPGTIVMDSSNFNSFYIEYVVNNGLYLTQKGRAELEITSVDLGNRSIECELNAELGSFVKSDTLRVRDYKIKLFY